MRLATSDGHLSKYTDLVIAVLEKAMTAAPESLRREGHRRALSIWSIHAKHARNRG